MPGDSRELRDCEDRLNLKNEKWLCLFPENANQSRCFKLQSFSQKCKSQLAVTADSRYFPICRLGTSILLRHGKNLFSGLLA